MGTDYYHPRELEKAAALLEEQEGTVLTNGGSDIILSISAGKITPTGIIDIRGTKSIDIITDNGQYVHIGGNVTYRQMQDSPVCGRIGGLARVVGSAGSPVTHMVATSAGNIITAAPSISYTPMMLAPDTELVLVSVRGEHIVRQKGIYLGAYKTDMQSNEAIREVRLPSLDPGKGSEYARFPRRKSRDIAKVIVGVVVTVDKKGWCLSAIVLLGTLNATAILVPSTEERIGGLGRDEAIQLALKFFPREAELRESYFKRYKEETICDAIAEASDMAFVETEREDSCHACGPL